MNIISAILGGAVLVYFIAAIATLLWRRYKRGKTPAQFERDMPWHEPRPAPPKLYALNGKHGRR